MIEVHVITEPGASLDDQPGASDAPNRHITWVWAALAMVAVVAMGGVVEGLSTRFAGEPPLDPDRVITDTDAHALCTAQLADQGVHRFTVPAYLPGEQGVNLQTNQPWHPGDTIKVVPHRKLLTGESYGNVEPQHIVTCTLPGG